MKVLSLFDGISCGRVALERAGIKVEQYLASEIDKYAIQVTQKNWPDTIQLGDVTKIDFKQFVGKIDLIIGGSPCQDLSIAKTGREGLSGKRSGLFFKFVEAIETIKPKYFLLENNVGMPKEAYEKISELMGCYPVEINSALVSGQQRKRFYWTNIGGRETNLFGFPTCKIPQPQDKGILLKDVLELENDSAMSEKSHAIISSQGRTTTREFFIKNQGEMKARRLCGFYNQVSRWGIYDKKHKAPTLTASMGMGGGFVLMYAEKSPMEKTFYCVKDKETSVRGKKCKIDLPDGYYQFFKLTPLECERLQTLPDNYTEGISNSQRYKCIGNGWTVDVIAHIFSFLPEEYKEKNNAIN
jgi:DNA (cytosine-5)-methyltransferase 3A